MSLRIRSKSGDEIDLAKLRRSTESRLKGMAILGEREPAVEINLILLDALEAALSVPEERYGDDRHNEMVSGGNLMRRAIRIAAGVVEETT